MTGASPANQGLPGLRDLQTYWCRVPRWLHRSQACRLLGHPALLFCVEQQSQRRVPLLCAWQIMHNPIIASVDRI